MAAPVDAGSIYADVRIRLDKLNGDIKSVQTSLDKITKASTGTAKKSDKGFAKLFKSMKLGWVAVAAAAGLALRATVNYLKESEQAASDAIEVYSKFDTVFESIQDSANNTADSFADSFGVAGSTARELLGTTGDLLVGMGATEDTALSLSVQVNEMAADLASFSNVQGGTKRASEALTAALLGETERMKLLGVVIRQTDVQQKLMEKGQSNLTGQALMLAKAQATLEITMEQSQKAMGDYARTADSAANVEKRLAEQSKALKEAVGVGLIPTVTAIRKKLGEWAVAITKVLEESNKLRDAEKAAAEGSETRSQSILLLEKKIAAERSKIELARKEIAEERKTLEIENIGLVKDAGEISIGLLVDENGLLDGIVEKKELNIRQLERQLEGQLRLLAAEKKVEDARIAGNKEDEAIALREQAIADAQLEALTELTRRQFEALSPQEQKLELIQKEIDRLAELKKESVRLGVDGQAIQNLINDLYRERAVLQAEELENDKVSIDFKTGIVEEWKEAEIERILAVGEAEKQAAADRKQELQDKIALTFQYANAVMGIFSSIANLQKANDNAELARMEANGATEEEIAARKKELQIEAAKREKKIALFQVAINTASAVVESLPNYILAGLAGATGLIQAAAIVAEPIPSFATGGIITPSNGGSLINVAENGSPELMLNSGASGQALLGEFANQIVAKMGGGNMTFNLVLPNGDVIAEASAPAFNNGRVELRVN